MDAATQAQIARVIWESIAEGKPVTDQQRAELARYILMGAAPVDEGSLADELDLVEAADRMRDALHMINGVLIACRTTGTPMTTDDIRKMEVQARIGLGYPEPEQLEG